MNWENLIYLFIGFIFSSLTIIFQSIRDRKHKKAIEKSRIRGLLEIYADFNIYCTL